MKLYIGIKDGKVWDKTTDLVNKRSDDIPDEEYFILEKGSDICIDDTWDFEKEINNTDSFRRFLEPEKTPDQIKIEELETTVNDLKTRLTTLEVK